MQEAEALIDPVAQKILTIAGNDCFGTDDETLADAVGKALKQQQHTLAVAESCTGGGLGQALTSVAGSSAYFLGGVIAYDNRIKQALLGVKADSLAEHGAVSGAVAEQMAEGVRSRLDTDWGLSVTGIAGPGGGSADKPVGLVYLGLASRTQTAHLECRFGASRGRDWVRLMSTSTALDWLRRRLSQGKDD